MKLDESCISNPEIRNVRLDWQTACPVQFEISDFGFEMQESSNFKSLSVW